MPARQDAHLDEFHRDQQWHKPVRVATTANVTIATALNSGDTIDGVTLADGDRVLVKDQSTGSQNGIYIAGATPARAYDMVYGIQAMGAFVYVRAGTTNGGTLWYNTNTTLPTIDTTALTWSNFAGGGGGGAPTTADYLVGTAQGGLSAEIVVGTTPGGELGGTWASPTVDATHSGSAHTDFIAKSTANAKGDLFTATANDTPDVLTVGSDDTVLMADSAQAKGLKWVPSQTPVTQSFGDSAAQGTADTYARGDHKHGMPADPGGSGATGSLAPAIFGFGSDGDVTISASTTLAPNRDYYYNNLTIQTGVVVDADAVRIFVKGTLDLQGTAVLHCDGRNGGNGGNGTIAAGGGAGSAGSAGTTGMIGPAAAGIAGKAGGFNGNGQNGTAGGSTTMGIQHSAGAAGGNSNTNTGGSAGTAPTATLTANQKPDAYPSVVTVKLMDGAEFTHSSMFGTAPGSGSGAGGSAAGGGGSGGSGGSGNCLVVVARTITGSGTLRAKGGQGGNGGNGFNGTGGSGGGGGGNGGAGGYVCLIYGSKSGWSGSIDVSGGAGGNGGTGQGTGTNGGNGNTGPTGHSRQFQMG